MTCSIQLLPPRWLSWIAGSLVVVAISFFALVAAPQPSHAQWGSQWGYNGPQYLTGAQRRRLRRQRARARQRARQRRQSRRVRSRRGKAKSVRTTRLPKRQSNSGPIQIVVSLGKQKMTVYEAGRPVGNSRVSTGKDGHRTPTGIFSIIHKRRRHFSNIYNNAPMPYMQRLTWSGIALHQGIVPNYRASHGCIRMPSGFARRLYGFTERRSHVVIADGNPVPQSIVHGTLFQPSPLQNHQENVAETAQSPTQPIRMAMNEAGAKSKTDAAPASLGKNATKRREQLSVPSRLLAMTSSDVELEAHRQLVYANRPEAPLRILITRKSQQQRIKEAQQILHELGYDAGEADGYIGKQTVRAIRAFQTANTLVKTGYPNRAFYDALYQAVGRTFKHTAFIYVRQKQKDIYSAEVDLVSPEKPMGTHLYTLMSIDDASGKATWNGLTAKARGRLPGQKRKKAEAVPVEPQTMGQALDRVRIPQHVRLRIEDMLTTGSSLIITDHGHTRETGIDTDFIVLTR